MIEAKQRKVYFSIDFPGLIKIIRSEWAANNRGQALEFLSGIEGLPYRDKIAIIYGSKKLIDDGEGNALLTKDCWNPYDHYQAYGGYAKPDTDLSLKTGWIADNGFFYYAAYSEHNNVARKSGLSEGAAENQGWIKLTLTTPVIGITGSPNEKQKETLFNWCTVNGYVYEHILGVFAEKYD